MQLFPRGNVFRLRKTHKSMSCLPLLINGGSLCLPWSLRCSLPGRVVPYGAARQQPCNIYLVWSQSLRNCRPPQKMVDCPAAAMLGGSPDHTGGLQSAPPGLAPALSLRGEAHPGDPAPNCSVPSMPYVVPQAQPEILTSKSMVEGKWSLFGVWGRR